MSMCLVLNTDTPIPLSQLCHKTELWHSNEKWHACPQANTHKCWWLLSLLENISMFSQAHECVSPSSLVICTLLYYIIIINNNKKQMCFYSALARFQRWCWAFCINLFNSHSISFVQYYVYYSHFTEEKLKHWQVNLHAQGHIHYRHKGGRGGGRRPWPRTKTRKGITKPVLGFLTPAPMPKRKFLYI